MSKPWAVCFDRDGTLASVAYIAPQTRDNDAWAQYNAALRFDAPVPLVAALLRAVRPGVTRIMTTGRTDNMKPAMWDWLAKHDLPIDQLFMRRTGDQRVDSTVKREIYENEIEPFWDVRLVVDDRPQVCDLWRDLGLHLIQVVDPGIMPFIGA